MSVRKMGRPPGVDGAETVTLILDEAERQFAAAGYAMTTNKTIATACGLTTAAIYHYFGTKAELYAAVCAQVHPPMLAAFEDAVAEVTTFRGRVKAILAASAELNLRRPSLAGFVMGGPVEARRHPELATVVDHHFGQLEALARKLVDEAHATGEIASSRSSDDIVAMMISILHGFAHHAFRDRSVDRFARIIDCFDALLDGELFLD